MVHERAAPLLQGDGRDAVDVLSQTERQSTYCNNWIGVRASSAAGEVPDNPIGIAAAIQHGNYGWFEKLEKVAGCWLPVAHVIVRPLRGDLW